MGDASALHRPPIAAHRLVSDGRSTALVDATAQVDWWCAPAMDSPPLLWSLLDRNGASARWKGVQPVDRSTEPAGVVARTAVRRGALRIECWDGLLRAGTGTALVRLARTYDGPLVLTHELAAGGFDQPWAAWTAAGGPAARLGSTTLAVQGGLTAQVDGHRLLTVVQAAPGAWAALVVTVDAGALPAEASALVARLLRDEQAMAGRLGGARLPRHHPRRAADALAVLEANTSVSTGAPMAAPTTSLPEVPGGDRQFDYRYCWLRDASLAISVAALLGRHRTAARYLHFVHGLVLDGRPPEHPVCDIRGGPVPAEREVAGVAGWAGSVPVRVGNAAGRQRQPDAHGFLVEGISVYLQTGGSLDGRTWRLVKALADGAAGSPPAATNGIWELRSPLDLVASDIGRWLALDRAIWIARGWRPLARRRRWKRARREARERVLGAIRPDGGLPQAYEGGADADASALLAVMFGMLHRRDRRAGRLVDATLTRLGSGPFVHRYDGPGDDGPEDGFRGREGAFVPVCWWAVSALAALGRVDEGRERADRLASSLPRLLAEEVDPVSGESLGNAPLVWSHAEAARAMYVLDAAAIRRRFGSAGLWAWRLGRYAVLRTRARRRGSDG